MGDSLARRGSAACVGFSVLADPALAQTGTVSGGDTAWVLAATALVLFMTLPGLALFYAGLVRVKNTLSVMMHCVAIACLVSVLWLAVGYSLAFSRRRAADRRPAKVVPAGRRPRQRSPGTIPETRLLHVPDDLRDHHAGADRRRLCRADQVRRRAAVQRAVAAAGLRAGRPLGLGRRLAGAARA